jgi:CYTH domain-containing protein
VEQSYLSIDPEDRIREEADFASLPITFTHRRTRKSDGLLIRDEVEEDLTPLEYYSLRGTLDELHAIIKDFRTYDIGNGLTLQCSLVDANTPDSFMYAEVEFLTEEEALAFIPPDYLGKEITYDPYYKMKNYWRRTRLERRYA